MTRTRAEEYRRLAQDCLSVARSASTEDVRTALTEQAEYWLRLAKEQDDEAADVGGPMPPPPAEPAQPPAQQQQQVQPKDDGNDKN
jgi:hypothetical protein